MGKYRKTSQIKALITGDHIIILKEKSSLIILSLSVILCVQNVGIEVSGYEFVYLKSEGFGSSKFEMSNMSLLRTVCRRLTRASLLNIILHVFDYE